MYIVRGHAGGILQFSQVEAVKIFLAFVCSGIRAVWPNRMKCCAWKIAERYSCLVVHVMVPCDPNSFRKHH